MFSIRCTPTVGQLGGHNSSFGNSWIYYDSSMAEGSNSAHGAAATSAIVENTSSSDAYDMMMTSLDHADGSTGTLVEMAEEMLSTKVIGAVCGLGLLGNALNLLVLTHRSIKASMERLERSGHRGMIALATSDLCLCLVLLPYAFVDRNVADAQSMTFDLVYTVYGVGVINTFIMTSTWLAVYMAVSRYLAIVHPLLARSLLGGTTFTYLSFAVIFLCSVAFNVPRFLLYTIAPLDCLVSSTHIYGF